MAIQETIIERTNTHGEFKDQASIIWRTLAIWERSPNWVKLPPFMKEAMHMTLHKYGRVMVGDFEFVDHWHDVVGYNQLVVDRLPLTPRLQDDPDRPGTPADGGHHSQNP